MSECRESFHARGDARDVMPTGDPNARASILESARVLVAEWMPELPWLQRRGDADVGGQQCPHGWKGCDGACVEYQEQP